MIAVVVIVVLILVVVGMVVAMVMVMHRRQSKQHVYEDTDANRDVRPQDINTLQSSIYYEPMSLDVDHTHIHHQTDPLHTPDTTSDNGDHNSMQDCPAYQPIEDTPTSGTGDYTYI